jgi:hypothetical protein
MILHRYGRKQLVMSRDIQETRDGSGKLFGFLTAQKRPFVVS